MIVYIGLGSNIGMRERTIERALALLDERLGERLRVAPYFYSAPQGFESEHMFCNTAAAYRTRLSAMACLDVTEEIERELGRTCKSEHGIYHDRTIDIDLLCAEDEDGHAVYESTSRLTLPHPRIAERDFVQVPLQAICLYKNS